MARKVSQTISISDDVRVQIEQIARDRGVRVSHLYQEAADYIVSKYGTKVSAKGQSKPALVGTQS